MDYRDADIYKYLERDKTLEKDIENLNKKVDWVQWAIDSYWGLIYRLVEYAEE